MNCIRLQSVRFHNNKSIVEKQTEIVDVCWRNYPFKTTQKLCGKHCCFSFLMNAETSKHFNSNLFSQVRQINNRWLCIFQRRNLSKIWKMFMLAGVSWSDCFVGVLVICWQKVDASQNIYNWLEHWAFTGFSPLFDVVHNSFSSFERKGNKGRQNLICCCMVKWTENKIKLNLTER